MIGRGRVAVRNERKSEAAYGSAVGEIAQQPPTHETATSIYRRREGDAGSGASEHARRRENERVGAMELQGQRRQAATRKGGSLVLWNMKGR